MRPQTPHRTRRTRPVLRLVAYDAGNYGLAQRYNIAALRASSSASDRPLGGDHW
ncbi:MAG: hypothetical protein ACRDSP_13260 [Pseudonocardiaceae bacterium]